VAALDTTKESQTVVVAKSSADNAATALTQLPRKQSTGSNVPIARQLDITAIKNVRAAEVPVIYSWVWGTKKRFERGTFMPWAIHTRQYVCIASMKSYGRTIVFATGCSTLAGTIGKISTSNRYSIHQLFYSGFC
jgi:hypothetical protein